MSHDPRQLGSLLDELDEPVGGARGTDRPSLRDRLNAWGGALVYGPWATRRRRIVSGAILGAAIIGAGTIGYLQTRPTPRPDYETDPLNELFDYTLLTDEFNTLSVEERLELLGVLYRRMQGMSASDSVLLAAFAAQIEGDMREQLEENVARLMLDTADMLALEYQDLPSNATQAHRERALEDAFVEFVRLGGVFEGRPVEDSRQQILDEGREEAQQREAELAADSSSLREADWVFNTMQDGMQQFSTPQQRARVTRFMRDITRHLRGQDIDTGEPEAPGGG